MCLSVIIVVSKIEEMYHEKMKDKATLTLLFGLNKTIDKKDDEKAPSVPKEVQATVKVQVNEMQTDLQDLPTNIEELIQLGKSLQAGSVSISQGGGGSSGPRGKASVSRGPVASNGKVTKKNSGLNQHANLPNGSQSDEQHTAGKRSIKDSKRVPKGGPKKQSIPK